MRLIRHIAPGHSSKAVALRTMTRSEFLKHAQELDEIKIEGLKAAAVRALSNYMLYESGTKDKKLEKAMNRFNEGTLAASSKVNTRNKDASTDIALLNRKEKPG